MIQTVSDFCLRYTLFRKYIHVNQIVRLYPFYIYTLVTDLEYSPASENLVTSKYQLTYRFIIQI